MALQNVMMIDNGKVISGGGGGGGTTDYDDLENQPQINGVTLSGNKSSSDLNIPKNFQGTIAQWNALTTEQKKTYDHASIPDSIDGGVTFPAEQVMMSDGETSVEEAIDNVYTATNGTGVSGAFHYTKIGRIVIGAGEMYITQDIAAYSAIVTGLPTPETITMGVFCTQDNGYNALYVNKVGNTGLITTRSARNNGEQLRLSCFYLAQS